LAGDRVKPGGYRLTYQTYAKLLDEITRSADRDVPVSLKEDLLSYYADTNAPISRKNNRKQWERVQNGLTALRAMDTRPN